MKQKLALLKTHRRFTASDATHLLRKGYEVTEILALWDSETGPVAETFIFGILQ